MKKLLIVIIISLLVLGAYMHNEEIKNTIEPKTYFYVGKSESWLATYSVSEVDGKYYDSLYIQNLNTIGNDEKIGPIEYILDGDCHKKSSSYPQSLKGVGNFHTGSIFSANAFTVEFNEEIKLTVKWQDKSETIKLYLDE